MVSRPVSQPARARMATFAELSRNTSRPEHEARAGRVWERSADTATAWIDGPLPQEVDLYARMFGHLQAAAVYGAAARALIVRALSELN